VSISRPLRCFEPAGPNVLFGGPNVRAHPQHHALCPVHEEDDMVDYADKTAVITGGTTGMGRGIAEALIERGAKVIVTGRDPDRLAATQRALGSRARVVRSDASSLGDIAALRDLVRSEFGALDAVFLNAGYAKLTLHEHVSEAEYDRTFAINTKGPFFTVQQLAPLVRAGGAFVFTTSISDAIGYPAMSAYAGSKAALRAFAQNFAAELVARNIRVNAVSPGFIDTPTLGVDASPEERSAFRGEGAKLTPMGRIGTSAEVARAALFLAFEATFTSGSELQLDGGMSQFQLAHDGSEDA
jgi:NAD(P)-dependent dehydrogenase (short-subunit alcohol dehydrogenase family)